MGAYVDRTLLPGEEVIAEGRQHWAMFVGPALLLLLAFMLKNFGPLIGFIAIIWGIYRLLLYFSIELAVTNKRVIAKTGIIRRDVIDVSNSKIEGVTYHQGIIGRMFGYGSVLVRGTGVGQVPIPFIEHPEHFKYEVGRILHA